jgi:iron complex outermembrane receptor protein
MAGIRVVAALGAGILVLMSVGAAAQQPLPEIVVTAPSPIASRPAGGSQGSLIVVEDAFAPVTVITEEDIRHATAHTLGDLLADKPGVAASTYAPGASRPIIRGLDNFRVRIQENGIGAHDVSDLGEDHGVPIDPLAAQKVEVVRGPATLRYGSQAIGGVVDVSNNRIPAFAPQRGISFVSKGALSSVDDGREAAMLLDAGSRNFAIHADAFSRRAWDYRIPDGSRQANSFVDSHGHSAGASFLFDNGFFGASVTRTLSRYGVPGVEAAESGTQIDLDQTKFNMKGELRPDSQAVTAIRFWFGASKYRHDELARENGEFGVISTFRNRQQEGRVEIEHGALASPLGMWNGAFGVQYANQRISTHGEAEEFLLPAHARTAAAYLFEQLKLTDTLKFQAAGRIERARASGTAGLFPADFIYAGVDPELAARERSFLPASLSAGVLQQLPFGVVASLTGQYVERADAGGIVRQGRA